MDKAKEAILALRVAQKKVEDLDAQLDTRGVTRTSKHASGTTRPAGWHQTKRADRKATKTARKKGRRRKRKMGRKKSKRRK